MNNYLKKLNKNRFFRRSMNVVLSGILATNMIGLNGYAIFSNINKSSDRVFIDKVGDVLDYLETENHMKFITYLKQLDNGKYAFCLEYEKPAPEGLMYTRENKITDLGVKHIVLSEPNMGSFKEDYFVKQVALNYYQGEAIYLTDKLIKGEVYRDKAIEIVEEAKRVRDGLMISPYFKVNEINISSSHNNKFTLSGDYYITDWFNVSYTGYLKNYFVNLTNAPNGIEVIDSNENPVSKLSSSDNKFKLRVHKSNITKDFDNIDISLTGNFDEIHPTIYIPDDDTYQIVLAVDEYPVQVRSGMSITGTIEPKGSIRLIKNDEYGNRLANVVFDLKKDGAVISTETTNNSGEILFSDLDLGTYELVEKNAPAGFVLDVTPTPAVVTAGNVVDATIINEVVKGRISVTKRDKELNNITLEGVEFEIYDNTGNVVDKIITNSDGYAISKQLDYGNYTMKEVKTNEGYHLNDLVYNISITEHQKTYSYDIENQVYKGKIHIVKVDSQDEETPVPNAGFDIIAENVKGIAKGTIVDNVVTDENGFAITENLRYGVYKVKEVNTPAGFWKSEKEYTVSILEDGKTYVKYIKNDPIEAKIRVVKNDGKDSTVLPGVTFKIVDKATGEDIIFKEYIEGAIRNKIEFTTDKYGEFITPQALRVGEYQLVETKSAEGYKTIEPIDFSINDDSSIEDIESIGKIITIVVSNDRISGDMKLTKTDTYTNEPLAGIEFSIECIDGFMKGRIFKEITDENGLISLNGLEYGKYKVTEIKTKESYVLNTEPQYFNIEKDEEIIELIFENKPKEGYIEVVKVDSDSKIPLKNVEFTIYNEFDEEIEKLITDKDGKAKSNKLKYGKYKIVETKTDENYIINEYPIDFEIVEEEQLITQEIENHIMKGDLDFTKVDSVTKKGLNGAKIEFVGKDEHNEYIKMQFISSEEGEIFRLPIGEYKIKEIAPPNNYTKTFKAIKFTIESDETTELILENKPNSSDGINKPLTGDDILFYTITSTLAILGLVTLNKDKLLKLRYLSNSDKFKRTGFLSDSENDA